jgi:2-desacetyl-2-hydroxyethyl bacteriochlorophyllide A dehydrogenase
MKTRSLYFTGPNHIEVRESTLPAPGKDQVLVETICSAISAGTEMLIYRGQFPRALVDSHDRVSNNLHYPLVYGYAVAGKVRDIGKAVNREWMDREVFAFQPHTSHFIATPDDLIPIPAAFPPESACLLPNMETAVNLVQDAAPILGENALVLGQGIVGLLTSSLLNEFPLESLITADPYELRRKASLEIGVTASLDPSKPDFHEKVKHLLLQGADLTIELSGSPSALNEAIRHTRFSGRVVIGSWYGDKNASIDLGGRFHRARIKLISSQVSTIAPELGSRWDKRRRFEVAWEALNRIQPGKWITHRYPLEDAVKAYTLLDQTPQDAIQIMIDYR